MTTTTYKNLRAIIQLCSIVLILLNFPLIFILFYYYDLFNLEAETLQMGYTSLTSMFKFVIISNITLGLFASCGINSRVKFYMRLYLLVCSFYLLLFIGCMLYVRYSYAKMLTHRFINISTANLRVKFTIENILVCGGASGSATCVTAIEQSIIIPIFYFNNLSLLSFILHLINIVFMKITVYSRIQQPKVKPPKFVNITRAGMDTHSLRNKRIIEAEIPLNTAVTTVGL